jgi:2Fe-2S ferredoxin
MGRITFVEHSGEEHEVEIEDNKSLMQLAMENGIPGIDADCGGACACGTCHVFIDKAWLAKAGEVFSEESQMLDMTPEREETSRLSCQVTVGDEMAGMKVRLPEFQM